MHLLERGEFENHAIFWSYAAPAGVELRGPYSGGRLAASSPGQVTELLRTWRDGDQQALAQLMPLVEAELRRLAKLWLLRELEGGVH